MTAQSWWGAELLDHSAPDAVFARAAREVTFGELRAEVKWLAQTLNRHGIRAGNTVALQGTPSFTHLWSIFALWSLGAQVLLFPPGMRGQDRVALLEMCGPQFFVSFGGLHFQTDKFIDQCEVLVRRIPDGQSAHSSHCVIQFSSGTTGRPKPVGRTSESLLVELDRLRTLGGMPTAGEWVAVLESVAHSFGLIGGVLYALDAGATAVFPTAQTPRAIAEAATLAHVVIGSPRHFGHLVNGADDVTLPELRLAVSGGEVLSRDIYHAFARRSGVSIGQAYGTTETGIIATDLAGMFGPPTIGLPVQGVRTRVVDGVLEVHVPQSPYPYQCQDLPWLGGWMSTHDLVTGDPETGTLRLRGRVDDGDPAHIDLLEIEAVVRGHEQVTDAVVFGVDPIEAHVASAADLDPTELLAWCRRFLGDDAPARYHVVRELPRTANGKVLRHRTRLHEHIATPQRNATSHKER
ncbi:MAG: class I adenylate-forming enzyme family protein [Pseudonocardiaceae bacterium]